MKNKYIKITANNEDLKYIPDFVPRLLEYVKKDDGINCRYIKNHHIVSFTVTQHGEDSEHGIEYVAHVYETKDCIVMDWEARNENK